MAHATPATRTRRAGTIAATLAFAAVTLLFDPRWLDFELARRGLLMAVAGVVVAGAAWRWPVRLRRERWPRGASLLVLLVGWHGIRTWGTTNPGAGWLDTGFWVALAVAFSWGSLRTRGELVRVVLPVLAVVAAYGLLQAAGLDWPAGYARADEPVSTLGNRNVAAEVTALGLALAALGVARATGRRAVWTAGVPLLLAGAYVGVLGSRGGFVAAAVALGLAGLALARRHRGLRASLFGATLALGIAGAVLRGGVAEEIAAGPEGAARPTPSTVAVRLQMWRAGLQMVAAEPLFGQGTGQFRYQYPRFRTPAEIELTTFGRQFPTFAATAHDDPLQLAIELGVPALLLALGFLGVVIAPWIGRSRKRWAALAPVGAFAAVAVVRSPLENAPAAAMLFAWLGALAAQRPAQWLDVSTVRSSGRVAMAAIGVMLLAAGSCVAGAEFAVASWLRGGGIPALDLAVRLDPFEPRYRSLRVVARCGGIAGDGSLRKTGAEEYAACRSDLAAIVELDPHNTNALLRTAELALSAGDTQAAGAALQHVLALDPREPRAVLLGAVLATLEGHTANAVAMLYADPHPRLRERLAKILQDLADAPALADHPADRALLEREAAFVRALDQVETRPGSALANAAVQQFAARAPGDDRARVLLARQLLALGRPEQADALGAKDLHLSTAAKRMLAPALQALASLPSWKQV